MFTGGECRLHERDHLRGREVGVDVRVGGVEQRRDRVPFERVHSTAPGVERVKQRRAGPER